MLAGLTWTAETGINQRNLKGSRSADRDEVCEKKKHKNWQQEQVEVFFSFIQWHHVDVFTAEEPIKDEDYICKDKEADHLSRTRLKFFWDDL